MNGLDGTTEPADDALASLPSVEVADVYKAGRLAAQLRRVPGGIVCAYLPDYDGPPIATSLAVAGDEVHTGGGALPAYFTGLLPEGRRLSALRRAVKTSVDDELSLLLAIGRDLVGDVQVVPAGERPVPAEPLMEVVDAWERVSFRRLVEGADLVDRVGLAGVQPKASTAAMISGPVARGSSRYILKLNPPEYPDVVENEHFFLGVARAAGHPVVETELVNDREGLTGLLVTRFDRVVGADGEQSSRAVEDGCQLLGRWPADKYRVTIEEVVAAMGRVCASPALAARDVMRQVCMAWLTGNGDLHAKNLSIVATSTGEWRVAPAHDVPSTLFYGDRSLALRVGGRTRGLSRRIVLEAAAAWGLAPKAAVRVVDECLTATNELAGQVREGVIPVQPIGTTLADAAAELRFRHRQLAGSTS